LKVFLPSPSGPAQQNFLATLVDFQIEILTLVLLKIWGPSGPHLLLCIEIIMNSANESRSDTPNEDVKRYKLMRVLNLDKSISE
jgi:hypothetical protein